VYEVYEINSTKKFLADFSLEGGGVHLRFGYIHFPLADVLFRGLSFVLHVDKYGIQLRSYFINNFLAVIKHIEENLKLKCTGYYNCIAHMYMLGQKPYIWNSRLLLQCTWDLCSSVLLLSAGWFVTDVSGQQVYPIFKGQKSQTESKTSSHMNFTNIWLQSGIIS